jgi:chemotaxis protein methyltransferase CheR
MELKDRDYVNLRDFIQKVVGVALGENKKYLVSQRLEPVVKAEGFGSFSEFFLKLKTEKDQRLIDRVIAAITTNETSFFRDGHPFETFKNIIMPELRRIVKERKQRLYVRRGPKVTIWCAASSTGQEPYSLAMAIREVLGNSREPDAVSEDFAIIASDVSSGVLARAIAGRYDSMEIARGLPDYLKNRFFRQEDGGWQVIEEVQRLVEFRRINLVENFSFLGGCDVIFCRNVLIYFDLQMRTDIIEQFHRILTPDGYLFLGASENIIGISEKFESKHIGRTIVYKKKPQQ